MKRRLGDVVLARRRARFVGRESELAVFAAALRGDVPGSLLYVHGVGGVGKTALLQVWAGMAEAAGRTTIRVDGHVVDPNAAAFLCATGDVDDASSVLFVDSYELLAPLDGWFREQFVSGLPAGTMVVVAGRQPPATDWLADPGWQDVVHVVALDNLSGEDSVAYLAAAGVAASARGPLAERTRGHPLALGLVVDVMRQRGGVLDPDALARPAVLDALVSRFVDEVPGQEHADALAAAVIDRFTTEDSLRAALGADEVRELFAWLRGLTCVEVGPRGLHPHDLARDVLDADLRWRDEERYQRVRRGVRSNVQKRIKTLRGSAQRDAIFDLFFTIRNDAPARPIWRWETLGAVVPEPVDDVDRDSVLALVAEHEGAESAELARYWLDRQPAGFRLYRRQGQVAGLTSYLVLTALDADAAAADPVVARLWAHVTQHGPLGPGDEILINRFRMDRDAYQGPSYAQDMVSVLHFQYIADRQHLRWDFQVLREFGPFLALSRINFHPMPGPGPIVAGHEYAILVRDAHEPSTVLDPVRPDPAPIPLDPERWVEPVRDALRNLRRPDALGRNPLMRLPSVVEQEGGHAELKELVISTARRLNEEPRDQKLFRALDRTYLRPAANQEAAAEMLGLPMTTYRRHLTRAVTRLTELLLEPVD